MGAHQFRPRPISREKRIQLEKRKFAKASIGNNSLSNSHISGGVVNLHQRETSPKVGKKLQLNTTAPQ